MQNDLTYFLPYQEMFDEWISSKCANETEKMFYVYKKGQLNGHQSGQLNGHQSGQLSGQLRQSPVQDLKRTYAEKDDKLSFVEGKIIIYKEVPENVSVLLGPTKNYDHYIIQRERGNNLKLPLGVYKFMMEFVK